MKLTTYDDKNAPMYHFISIGGRKEGCVTIEVDEKNNGFGNYKIAHINSIEYNKNCNKYGTLLSGEGTRNMIEIAMNVTQQLCSWVTSFSLKDASARMCSPDGPEINLADMYIALYGKTWYEYHFGARIQNHDSYELYKSLLKKLRSKRYKTANAYEKFKRAFNVEFPESLKNIFEQSETFQIFFASLNMSKEEICIFLRPWITKFIRDLILERNFFIENEWIIDHQHIKIELHNIEESRYKNYSGGYNFRTSNKQLI